jgi:hypothetical protein
MCKVHNVGLRYIKDFLSKINNDKSVQCSAGLIDFDRVVEN